jgi:serine/threonine protein kinase
MQGKGYSFEADYWSLGVLFYELVCGSLPFAEKIENPYQVYEEIMKKKVAFPDFFIDQAAKTIMLKLLNKSIQQRGLGRL